MHDVVKKPAATELDALSARWDDPAATELEAKILGIVGPAPEQRHNCLRNVRLVLLVLLEQQARPTPPPNVQKELNRDVLRGLRIIKNALAAGASTPLLDADFLLGRNAAEYLRRNPKGAHPLLTHEGKIEFGYQQVRDLYERQKLGVEWEDRMRPSRRSGKRRDPILWWATYEACQLLRAFSRDPPTKTRESPWHRLTRVLYHAHGGRGDVYQTIRDTPTPTLRPKKPDPLVRQQP